MWRGIKGRQREWEKKRSFKFMHPCFPCHECYVCVCRCILHFSGTLKSKVWSFLRLHVLYLNFFILEITIRVFFMGNFLGVFGFFLEILNLKKFFILWLFFVVFLIVGNLVLNFKNFKKFQLKKWHFTPCHYKKL